MTEKEVSKGKRGIKIFPVRRWFVSVCVVLVPVMKKKTWKKLNDDDGDDRLPFKVLHFISSSSLFVIEGRW